MNNQTAFNTVVKHLVKQNWQRSESSDGNCAYRGRDGLMCAVGCLIPDEKYRTSWDYGGGIGVLTLMGDYPDLFPNVDHDLLNKLQKFHDSEMFVNNIDHNKYRLRKIADHFKLECKEELFECQH
jgi:hypothetical protein